MEKSKNQMNKEMMSWFEIPAVDFDRAVRFYSSVFQIEMKTATCGEEQMGCFPGFGMISKAPGFKPSLNGPILYFNAAGEIDQLIERMVEHGGAILRPKTEITGDQGVFALMQDSEGNRIGLYQP